MEEIKNMEKIKNWEEFEKKLISEEKQRTENFKNEVKKRGHRLSVTDPLFRGQADEMWSLSTTLERFYQERGQNLQEFSTKEYFGILKKINHGVSSNYGLPEKCEDKGMGAPAGYDLMAHLRHHRFPSPLLDWTVSPYIAAYFAFRDPNITNDAAIYVFRETVGQGKISDGEMSPNIWVPGPYVCTHPRHHKQQAQYTVCRKQGDSGDWVYCSHENNFDNAQNVLKQYIIPKAERQKFLANLDQMNINDYSLFGDKYSLMNTLAYREIEKFFESC